MKILVNLAFAVSFMFATSASANTITLSLEQSEPFANTGDLVSVSVMIDGLGNYDVPSVGSFLIDVVFDTEVLSFSGYSLSNYLGDAADVDDYSGLSGNTFTLDNFSWLTTNELWALQPGSFVLAELLFTVNQNINNITGALAFGDVTLWRASGQEFLASNVDSSSTASVTVPAPSAVMLIALGLIAMFTKRKMLFKKA
jgi:hypothetical protein